MSYPWLSRLLLVLWQISFFWIGQNQKVDQLPLLTFSQQLLKQNLMSQAPAKDIRSFLFAIWHFQLKSASPVVKMPRIHVITLRLASDDETIESYATIFALVKTGLMGGSGCQQTQNMGERALGLQEMLRPDSLVRT